MAMDMLVSASFKYSDNYKGGLNNGKRISWAIFACNFRRFWSLNEGFCPPITGEPKGVIASYVTERRFQKRLKDMLNSYHY